MVLVPEPMVFTRRASRLSRVRTLECSGLPRSESCPLLEASVRRAISFCSACTTAATLLTACFHFSWSPL